MLNHGPWYAAASMALLAGLISLVGFLKESGGSSTPRTAEQAAASKASTPSTFRRAMAFALARPVPWAVAGLALSVMALTGFAIVSHRYDVAYDRGTVVRTDRISGEIVMCRDDACQTIVPAGKFVAPATPPWWARGQDGTGPKTARNPFDAFSDAAPAAPAPEADAPAAPAADAAMMPAAPAAAPPAAADPHAGFGASAPEKRR